MDALAVLQAIEDIKSLKARYFRAMDTRNVDLLRNVFAQSAEVDYRGAMTDPTDDHVYLPEATLAPLRGDSYIAETLMRLAQGLTTAHQGFMPEIEVIGESSARGVWAMFDVVRFKDHPTLRGMEGYGHYHETYVHEHGAWRIATMRLTRLMVDFHPRPPAG